MNVIMFSGNLGRDAEVRDASDTTVCNFSVAVRQGISRDAETEWYRCEIWGKRAEAIAEYLRKGEKVCVVGDLVIEEYDGKPQYRVRVHEVDFMSSAGGGGGNGRGSSRRDRDDDRDTGRRSSSRDRDDDRGRSSRGRDDDRRSSCRERAPARSAGRRVAEGELDDDVPF